MLVPSLNTLGMPDWSFERVVRFAFDQNVPYVEIRGLDNSLELLNLPDLNDPERVRFIRALLLETGVRILSFNLSLRMIDFSPEMAAQIQQYADLALRFDVPYLRFFAGGDVRVREEFNRLVSQANRVADILKDDPVTALVETHDTLVHSTDIQALVLGTGERIGVLWDAAHTMNLGGESWQETFARLQPYIRYLHVKDEHISGDQVQYTPLFEGDLPMKELLLFLKVAQKRSSFRLSGKNCGILNWLRVTRLRSTS